LNAAASGFAFPTPEAVEKLEKYRAAQIQEMEKNLAMVQ
jgi:hypothetical protein